jgi:hypothetical protein
VTSQPQAGGILSPSAQTKHNIFVSPAIERDRARLECVRKLRFRFFSLFSRATGSNAERSGGDTPSPPAVAAERDSAAKSACALSIPPGFDIARELRAAPRYRVLIIPSLADSQAREFFMVAVDAATAERRALNLFARPLSVTVEPADAGAEIPSSRLTILGEEDA